MVNHWDRRGWWPGRRAYYWYLTFEHQPELQELARICQVAIEKFPSFNLVPLEYLHMTLDRVGFADEITDDDLLAAEKVTANATRHMRPFTISVGPLAGSTGALSFSASPRQPIDRLRLSIAQEAAKVVRTIAPDGSHFRPHVGIAYCNQSISAGPVIETVRSLRQLAPVTVRVNNVSLVRLTREQQAYTWSAVRTFPLGSRAT
jgi:2'-5' RNA ligase